jgi:hypothetical protein
MFRFGGDVEVFFRHAGITTMALPIQARMSFRHAGIFAFIRSVYFHHGLLDTEKTCSTPTWRKVE